MGFLIKGKETELRMSPALGPFIVINECPREVTLNSDTVVYRAAHLGDMLTEVAD